jgi:hypothetical protein
MDNNKHIVIRIIVFWNQENSRFCFRMFNELSGLKSRLYICIYIHTHLGITFVVAVNKPETE